MTFTDFAFESAWNLALVIVALLCAMAALAGIAFVVIFIIVEAWRLRR